MKKRFLLLTAILILIYLLFPFSLEESARKAGRAWSESEAFREVFSLSEEKAAEVFAPSGEAAFL